MKHGPLYIYSSTIRALSVFICLLTILIAFLGKPTLAIAEDHTFTFQSSAQAGGDIFRIELDWASRIHAMSAGRVRIDLLPVNAVVQYDETLGAVGSGILDGHITEPS